LTPPPWQLANAKCEGGRVAPPPKQKKKEFQYAAPIECPKSSREDKIYKELE